jgi:hypothetical protein
VTLEPGDLLLVPPNVPRAFEAAGSEAAELLFELIHVKPWCCRPLESAYPAETDWTEVAATSDHYNVYSLENKGFWL